MQDEIKTMAQLEAELKEFFTTNSQGKEDMFARRAMDEFMWQEQRRRNADEKERFTEGYKILLPSVLSELSDNIKVITKKWPRPYASPHEGLAVLLEEVDELSKEVFLKEDAQSRERIYKEAADVAAVAIRIMIEYKAKSRYGVSTRDRDYFNNFQ